MLFLTVMRTQFSENPSQSLHSTTAADKPLVLVVDDDPAMMVLMTNALENDGMQCVTATTVEEALKALQTYTISITVLDWGLDRCGSEVLSVAKELFPAMPVVAISGLPFEVRTDAVVQKADAFLHKPFSATVLTGQVKQLLERARRPSIPLPQTPEAILSLQKVQAIYIRHVVALLGDNKSKAAAALGIHRQTISAALKNEIAG